MSVKSKIRNFFRYSNPKLIFFIAPMCDRSFALSCPIISEVPTPTARQYGVGFG
ncbi:hypothetical protein [uncultured Nostoc sp.]|uniref:hypothetical protein n=1 Tax=uncultured Nostoc sp. TaxID=340711 RepID=UPI0035CA1FC0